MKRHFKCVYLFFYAALPHEIRADTADSAVNDLSNIDINALAGQLSEKLPPGVLPEGFNATQLPKIDDFLQMVRQKCEKNTGTNATFEMLSNATNVLRDCVTNLIDFGTLQEEIEIAQPKGDLDTVFNKYANSK